MSWLSAQLDGIREWTYAADVNTDNLSFGFSTFLKDMMTIIKAAIARLAKPGIESLYQWLCAVKEGYISFQQCDISGVVSILIVRSTIRSLAKFRIGTDAFAWGTVDLELVWRGLEDAVDYVLNALCPTHIPSIGETIECYVQGQIDDKMFACWLAMHGGDVKVFQAVVDSRRDKLSSEELIEWCRRHEISDADTSDALRRYGWTDKSERDSKVELYDELPSIADHLHWLQRNVFDDAYVKDYDLMNGFEERFWVKFRHDLRAQGMKKEYAALHYAAHWINPSPGQLFEMLRRLRPGRVAQIADGINAQNASAGLAIPPVTPEQLQFTSIDLSRLLAEQDVAPYFRARLRAIAYTPFGLRFLRQLYDTRQIDDAELSQRFQDIGYAPADADMLARSESIRRARTVATGVRGYTVPTIKALFMAAKITRQVALDRLAALGYPAEVGNDAIQAWIDVAALKHDDQGAKNARNELLKGVKEGLIVGVLSQDQAVATLAANGYSQENARTYVIAIVTNDRIRLTQQGIAQIRRGVMAGRLSLDGAAPLLIHLGLTPDKAQEYINVWTYDLEAGKRVLGQSQIIKLATEGLISIPVAQQRLLNLGYTDVDTLLLSAEAQQRIASAEQKVLDSEHKSASMQAKAVAAAIKQSQAQLARFQKQLYALGSPKQIGTWYKDGLVGVDFVNARMNMLGYVQGDIDLMIEQWTQEASKANAKQQKAAAGSAAAGATGP